MVGLEHKETEKLLFNIKKRAVRLQKAVLPMRDQILDLEGINLDAAGKSAQSRLFMSSKSQEGGYKKKKRRVRDKSSPRKPETSVERIVDQIFDALGHKRHLYGQVVSTLPSLFYAMDTNKDGEISVRELTRALRRLDVAGLHKKQVQDLVQKLAGIPHATPHVLRHTAITEGVHAEGVSIVDVSHIAGHKDLKTTMGYIHSAPERLHQAVANLPAVGGS